MSFMIPHMLTIKETAETFHISEHFVRNAAKMDDNNGKQFTIKSGRKYLINAERFSDFLNGKLPAPDMVHPAEPSVPGIRPIPVKV